MTDSTLEYGPAQWLPSLLYSTGDIEVFGRDRYGERFVTLHGGLPEYHPD